MIIIDYSKQISGHNSYDKDGDMKGNLLTVDDEVDLSVNMNELLEDEAQNIFIANN